MRALFWITLLLLHSEETFDSPQRFYGNGTKLIENAGFQLVTEVNRMRKHFLFKTSHTRASLEPLGQAKAAAMTRRQIEIWCDFAGEGAYYRQSVAARLLCKGGILIRCGA
jgi:hypothetical protein